MKLTVLGSGTMPITKDRNPSSLLLEVGNKRLLIDAGHGALRRLIEAGRTIHDLDAVFVSHFHTDHFADVFPLVHSRWVDDMYRRRPSRRLLLIGPEGLGNRFTAWRKIFWPEPAEHYPLTFSEGSGRRIRFGSATLSTFRIEHIPWFKSVGLTVTSRGRKIVYTGDVGSRTPLDRLIAQAKNADLFITEASFNAPTPNHYTIKQVEAIAARAKVKQVLIVHIRPQDLAAVRAYCATRKTFTVGRDLQRFTM